MAVEAMSKQIMENFRACSKTASNVGALLGSATYKGFLTGGF